ncbi:hypothetical protein BU23DRAFT_270004 [Bimuria novae-zelandiae CBS 107.79]|uniref:Uncharacterized protein n=1 Tax=Bimuria novae-zelandiae CBS 107.79 TaxID=1447943 RepID=A0A6A5USD2_9PLEO|nr:hypothetical protein BU23DRAFT_270004 [Bimuria novae-zelandiae CBS 107.79]
MLSSSAHSSGRLPRKWTVAEDHRLREEVETQMVEGEVKDWCRIAAKLPGRTNKDCRKRWHNSVAGGLKKGQWSKSEDVQLAKGVGQYGQRWTLVASVVGTRSADQCAKRWQQSLDPDLDRSEWRDTDILIDAVQKLGRHWKDIQRHHFQGRSKNCIKNRYTVLVRRYQNQGITLPQAAGTPEPSAYSATDDDNMSYGSSIYDDLLPSNTEVSTPETQQSWSANGPYSGWTSQESFNIVPSTASNYAPVHQPLTVNVSQASQWDWATTSMTHSPMMPLASPQAYPNVSDHGTLSAYDHFSATPSMLSPTTTHYPGNTARGGPTSSPIPSTSTSPSYQDPHAIAQFMRYGVRRDSPYQY